MAIKTFSQETINTFKAILEKPDHIYVNEGPCDLVVVSWNIGNKLRSGTYGGM